MINIIFIEMLNEIHLIDISPLLIRDKNFNTKLKQHLREGKLFYSYTCDSLFGTYGSTTSLSLEESREMVKQFFAKVINMQEILAGVNEVANVIHRIYKEEQAQEKLLKYFQSFIEAQERVDEITEEELKLLETQELNLEDDSYTTQGKTAEQRIWIFKKKAELYESEGLPIRAIEEYNKILSLNPNLYIAWYQKGLLHQKAREISRAIACFDECIKLDPSDPKPYLQKASMYISQMRFEEALAMYDKVLSLDRDNFDALMGKARCLHKLSKPYMEWISRARRISKKRTEELMKEYGLIV
ncbi:MAG: tetratricopeptide repeat protein [Halobacteria archaeon]